MTSAPRAFAAAGPLAAAMLLAAAPAPAQPRHFLILQSSNLEGGSDYEIDVRGEVEKAEGSLAGISVTANDDDSDDGRRIEGQVSRGADGYRIDGAIAEIDIDNPGAVQLFTGLLRGGGSQGGGSGGGQGDGRCRVGIVAQSVDFVHGQGAGEGPLELRLTHSSGRRTNEGDLTRLPPGNRRSLGDRVFARRLPRDTHISRQLSVEITEVEDDSDYFTGDADSASADLGPVELGCDVSREIHREIALDGAAEEVTGRVRVNYAIGVLGD